jgi:hypothetical protein
MATPANPRRVEFSLAEDGEHVEIWHDCTERRNQATLPLASEGWTVETKQPLTVRPSVHCGDCGLHGWITSGQWWNA